MRDLNPRDQWLIGAALDVVMREWHTTPDRCAQLMKDRLSSIPVSTASFRKRKILDPFFWQLGNNPFLLLEVKILVFDAFLVSSGYHALFSE